MSMSLRSVRSTVRYDPTGSAAWAGGHMPRHGTLRIVYYLYLSYILYNYITHATFF